MSEQTELIPSSDLTRTRRNFLFATSILFVLAMSPPATGEVNLPGLGELRILVAPALTMLVIVSVLFFVEYCLEYWITTIRNSSMVAGRTDDNRAETFDSSLRKTIDAINTMRGQIDSGLSNLIEHLDKASRSLTTLKPGVPEGDQELIQITHRNMDALNRAKSEAVASIKSATHLEGMLKK